MLYLVEYIIDNRLGDVFYINVVFIDENFNLDLILFNNVLYKFNFVEGGVIVFRGCFLVGIDFRCIKIIFKYVFYFIILFFKNINIEE